MQSTPIETGETTSASARVFLIRHGQTDWTLSGKHTSHSQSTLSKAGEDDVRAVREAWVGVNKLIDPRTVARIYCSPRTAARRTVEILQLGIHNHQHFFDRDSKDYTTTASQMRGETAESNIQITGLLQEWNYGDYEDMTLWDIRKCREKQGKGTESQTWNIWTEGCPGGESPEQISQRVDELIAEIKSFVENTSTSWPSGHISGYREQQAEDVVCVAHGHVLMAMALRWVGAPLSRGQTRMVFEPGSVLVLGFEHDNLNNPAIVVGRKPGQSDRTL